MSASDLHESMINPAVRGQYLAAIRNRGKDVLINDVSEAMDLLVSMAVKLEAAQKRIAELEAYARPSQQARDGLLERAIEAEEELARRDALEPAVYEAEINGVLSSVTKSHYEDCKKYGVRVRTLYATPQPATLPSELDNDSGFVDLYRNGYNKAISDARELGCKSAPIDEILSECEWIFDYHDYFWQSSCGESWMFTDGGPDDNHVKFCQGCGGLVRIAAAPTPGE